MFELAAPPRLGLVCFRLACGDETSSEKTALLVERATARGKIALNAAQLGEENGWVVRMAIGGTNTTAGSVALSWRELVEVARGCLE